jgi:hypothetical protein
MVRLLNAFKSLSLAQITAHIRTPLYWNAYALIFSDGASAVLGVLYWALVARLYSTQDVGLNSAAIATATALANLAFLYLMRTLVRFIPTTGRNINRLISVSYLASIVMALVFGLIFVFWYQTSTPEQNFLAGGRSVQLWYLLSIPAWCVFTLQDSVLVGLRQTIWVPVKSVCFGLIKIGLVVAFATWLGRCRCLCSS